MAQSLYESGKKELSETQPFYIQATLENNPETISIAVEKGPKKHPSEGPSCEKPLNMRDTRNSVRGPNLWTIFKDRPTVRNKWLQKVIETTKMERRKSRI